MATKKTVIVAGSYNIVSNLQVRLQTGSDRLLYATWNWYKGNTDNYKVTWRYYTGDGVWFFDNESTVDGSGGWSVRATYTAPSNALKVACTVLPISKTYEKKKKDKTTVVNYWKADATTAYFTFAEAKLPSTPGTPTVSISDSYRMTVELNVSDPYASSIEFEIVQDNNKTYKTGIAKVTKQYAKYSLKIDAGHSYKARARARKDGHAVINVKTNKVSYPFYATPWSEYSSNVTTVPSAPKIKEHKVSRENVIWLRWDAISTATGYTIEYSVSKYYFDKSTQIQSKTVTDPAVYIESLDTGRTWYFRVKANNSQGDSGWSNIYSVVLGVVPAAPTTWTEVATAVAGDTVRLYWMHNSEDGSTQQDAIMQIALDNGPWTNVTPTYISPNVNEASYHEYSASIWVNENLVDSEANNVTDSNSSNITATHNAMSEGTVIRWRVKTRGVLTTGGPTGDGYSAWSTERVLIVYAPPTIGLIVTDDESSDLAVYSFEYFPICIKATAGPDSQRAVGWYISVVANESYEAYDQIGRIVTVSAGDEIYSEYISSIDGSNELVKVLNAGDIDLENEIYYSVNVRVAMSSGMTAEASQDIHTDWTADNLWPNAEIAIDDEKLYAYIRPYCVDRDNELIENVVLSVYRRDYDGRFTEIATNIPNDMQTVVVDPHPSLDYARYRIVGMYTENGLIGYYDMPGEPVGETGIVLQWEESWSNFNMPAMNGDMLDTPVWSGSMVKLPYNVKVSESTSIDKNLVEYIGRSAPVSYYGTQLGVSGSWSSDIPADDAETRYALRRLQIWPGNVYVREPNGVGYWASVEVSFSKDYDNVLTPVSINVTRVEGGM